MPRPRPAPAPVTAATAPLNDLPMFSLPVAMAML